MSERIKSVERWANFVRENPKKWKAPHTEFINAQFQKADDFIKLLSKQKNGKKKIAKLYNIMNVKGYPALFAKSRS